jgi:antitoxin (DNA-binding transcriptional repressor) of toxin-antitoxin stability system
MERPPKPNPLLENGIDFFLGVWHHVTIVMATTMLLIKLRFRRHPMITISKSKLKTHMLQIFRQIEQTGEEVIVTDNNRPVLRIQPLNRKRSVDKVFAPYRGQMVFHENPDAPTIDEWSEV